MNTAQNSMQIVSSFDVSAVTRQGAFAALVLKFACTSGTGLLTGWAKPQLARLMKALQEYIGFLSDRGIDFQQISGHAKDTMSRAPAITQDELENLTVAALVESVAFRIASGSTDLQIELTFAPDAGREVLLVQPMLAEWLLGYIGNVLNVFNEDGTVPGPPESMH